MSIIPKQVKIEFCERINKQNAEGRLDEVNSKIETKNNIFESYNI
jgi:hypothetical protein